MAAMRKPRASRLVIPSTLSVAIVTAAVAAASCSKETTETNPEEGACVALDQPDGGPTPDCSAQPDGGECPPGCTYI
jgi:hypothetical protein